MFSGSFLHNIDKKGRIFIPAKMREDLGVGFVLSVPIDGEHCLSVCTTEHRRSLQEKIDQLPMVKRKALNRAFGPLTVEIECDVQGRILIPPLFREYAGLGDSAYIVGTNDEIEIWDKDSWEKKREQLCSESIAELVGSIDF